MNEAEGTAGAMDHLEGLSVASSHVSMGGDIPVDFEPGMTIEQKLTEEKGRLEE